MLDDTHCIIFRQTFDLIVEREQFTGFRGIHLDGLTFAIKLQLHRFLALSGFWQPATRLSPWKARRRSCRHEPGEQHILAVAGGGSTDAGDDAEEWLLQAVIDAVDGVTDPASGAGA